MASFVSVSLNAHAGCAGHGIPMKTPEVKRGLTEGADSIISSIYCALSAAVTSAKDTVTALVQSAPVTPVRQAFEKGYAASETFYNDHTTAVQVAAVTAITVGAVYCIYKKYCPVAQRCDECQQDAK
jgi:hypothetical protein